MNNIINHNQAILLFYRKFDVPTIYPYLPNGEVDYNRDDLLNGSELFINYNYRNDDGTSVDIRGDVHSAPTQSQVVDWLLDKHELYIAIETINSKHDNNVCYEYTITDIRYEKKKKFNWWNDIFA